MSLPPGDSGAGFAAVPQSGPTGAHTGAMVASLIARGVTVHTARALVLDEIDLVVSPGERIGLVGPNGVGQVDPARRARRPGHDRRHPRDIELGARGRCRRAGTTDCSCRAAAAGAGTLVVGGPSVRSSLDVPGVHRVRPYSMAATAALAAGDPGSDDRLHHRLRPVDGARAADSTRVSERCGPSSGSPGVDRSADRVLLSGGEAARTRSRRCCCRDSTCSSSTSRPTISTSTVSRRLEAWVVGLRAGVVIVSHDRTFLERVDHRRGRDRLPHASGDRVSAAVGRRSWRNVNWRGNTPRSVRRLRHETPRAARSCPARARWPAGSRQGPVVGRDRQAHPSFPDQSDRAIRRQGGTNGAGDRATRSGRRAAHAMGTTPRHPDGRGSGDLAAFASRDDRPGVLPVGTDHVQPTLGERIAVVGANGAGIDLIDVLLGRVTPGSRGRPGSDPTSASARWNRPGTAFVGASAMLEVFMAEIGPQRAGGATFLAKFGLAPITSPAPPARCRRGTHTNVTRPAHGERREPVVLDEPTNHLDLPAIEQLEQALDSFAGTVLLVTHDRSLLERTRITRSDLAHGPGGSSPT